MKLIHAKDVNSWDTTISYCRQEWDIYDYLDDIEMAEIIMGKLERKAVLPSGELTRGEHDQVNFVLPQLKERLQ